MNNETIVALLSNKKVYNLLILSVVLLGAGLAWYTYNSIRTGATSSAILEDNRVFNQKNQVMTVIPHRTPFYSISYDEVGEDSLKLKIFTTSPYYRSQAIQYLIQTDPLVTTKYEIVFIDYKSPLGQTGDSHAN